MGSLQILDRNGIVKDFYGKYAGGGHIYVHDLKTKLTKRLVNYDSDLGGLYLVGNNLVTLKWSPGESLMRVYDTKGTLLNSKSLFMDDYKAYSGKDGLYITKKYDKHFSNLSIKFRR